MVLLQYVPLTCCAAVPPASIWEKRMRRVIASALWLVLVGCAAMQAASQAGSAAAVGQPAPRACSLLTKEVVMQVTPYEKQARDVVMRVPASEEALGRTGSECTYGGITLQIDPFPAATFEKQRDQTWVAVNDVGDGAYFRDNKGRWAELYARSGTRVLTIQMAVPNGRTAASIQPNVVALAKTLLPKLK
jgi:hypothetical protein